MKNIHILPTDEQIKNVGDLVKDKYGDIHIFTKNDGKEYGKTTTKLNIYITSDEEIKEGDWIFDIVTKKNEIAKFNHNDLKRDWKKIILTTDQDLIKDGVQAIDDEFLEWFVNNPSCEEVEVEMNQGRYFDYGGNIHITNAYKIIIPKEEPKQSIKDRIMSETSEEIKQKARDYGNSLVTKQKTLKESGEYQQELFNYLHDLGVTALQSEMQEIERIVLAMQDKNKYSEEEVKTIAKDAYIMGRNNILIGVFNKWFKQFKNK